MAASASTQAWTFAGSLELAIVKRSGRTGANHGLDASRPGEEPACFDADAAIGATGVFRRVE